MRFKPKTLNQSEISPSETILYDWFLRGTQFALIQSYVFCVQVPIKFPILREIQLRPRLLESPQVCVASVLAAPERD